MEIAISIKRIVCSDPGYKGQIHERKDNIVGKKNCGPHVRMGD
jgi:hypothetical protein